jgi:hypothetical protein
LLASPIATAAAALTPASKLKTSLQQHIHSSRQHQQQKLTRQTTFGSFGTQLTYGTTPQAICGGDSGDEEDDMLTVPLIRLPSPLPLPLVVPASTMEASPSSHAASAALNPALFHNILEQTAHKFVVHPHPQRGFRQWIVRRKAFNAVTRVLNFWCDGSMNCLTVTDLIQIVHSLVPRAQLGRYRVMRLLPVAIQRLGLQTTQELSGAVLAKIFSSALEVSAKHMLHAVWKTGYDDVRCCCTCTVGEGGVRLMMVAS